MALSKIINDIIKENDYKTFLLIGADTSLLNSIECEKKQMVGHDFLKGNINKFDVILIDGVHTAEQVQQDILDSWKDTKAKGVILVHDIKPHDEAMQRVPREQNIWTGDVWKAWHGFKQANPNVKVGYIEETYGLGVIYKSKGKLLPNFISEIDFQEYFDNQLWEVK
jgi:hypothetical protein